MKRQKQYKDRGSQRRKQKSKGKTGKVGDISLRKTSDPTHSVGAKLNEVSPLFLHHHHWPVGLHLSQSSRI